MEPPRKSRIALFCSQTFPCLSTSQLPLQLDITTQLHQGQWYVSKTSVCFLWKAFLLQETRLHSTCESADCLQVTSKVNAQEGAWLTPGSVSALTWSPSGLLTKRRNSSSTLFNVCYYILSFSVICNQIWSELMWQWSACSWFTRTQVRCKARLHSAV